MLVQLRMCCSSSLRSSRLADENSRLIIEVFCCRFYQTEILPPAKTCLTSVLDMFYFNKFICVQNAIVSKFNLEVEVKSTVVRLISHIKTNTFQRTYFEIHYQGQQTVFFVFFSIEQVT